MKVWNWLENIKNKLSYRSANSRRIKNTKVSKIKQTHWKEKLRWLRSKASWWKNKWHNLSNKQYFKWLRRPTSKRSSIKRNWSSKFKCWKILKLKIKITSSLSNKNRNYLFICRKKIKLTNNNSTATNPELNYSPELALVEGVVLKKGSSIRFKI